MWGVCVCVMDRVPVSYKHPVISWFIYLRLACVTFGCTVPRWRWGFLVGSVNVSVCVCGKENSVLILFERVLGVCVSLSRMYCRGNRPCFVRAGGEVGVWGCHSTYSRGYSNVQTFGPGAAAPSSLWAPRHLLLLPHTCWCYLNKIASIWGMCLCCRSICTCLYVWIHNRTWMQQWFDLAELEGLNMNKFRFFLINLFIFFSQLDRTVPLTGQGNTKLELNLC